ncbi:putative Thaumatin-like protein [Cocos nucifera]|uniref:Putative Thaumatin-like protein n=1 Tax=Cocos nucifera TaxID=13894 RepID=A0A8K0NCP4_COCNU|nr:putative Thaumatin-like protein [Cocos nucifera]
MPRPAEGAGGCHNPCTVFKMDQYCCIFGRCRPTNYSQFFKRNCPTSYSFPLDDPTNTFTCPAGTNHKVVFCPQEIGHVFI